MEGVHIYQAKLYQGYIFAGGIFLTVTLVLEGYQWSHKIDISPTKN